MKLAKSIVVNGQTIPAGTELSLGAEGLSANDIALNLQSMPADCLDNAALEAVIKTKVGDLPTKGTLAIKALIAHIAVVLDNIQDIDKPELIRILRLASQSASSGANSFIGSVGSRYTI